jgi:fatty-acyl-CoA synthase
VIIPSRFNPAEAATLAERYAVTHLNGSDDMLLAVMDQGRDLGRWRHGMQAEFAGRGEEAVARAELIGARITGAYGSSETFAVLTRWLPSDPAAVRHRMGGVPVDPATKVRTVDTTTGAVLPAGESGELQLRGPSVLSAYLVEHGTAPPPLTADGWFPTGDLGRVQPDGGFLYFARLGDTLRLAGFLTDPAEVEQHLLAHPAVNGAQVVGAPKQGGGEVAVAFVLATGGVDEAALLSHCRHGLANYKVPARILLVDAFPTVDGANGVKIQKAELRERAARLAT